MPRIDRPSIDANVATVPELTLMRLVVGVEAIVFSEALAAEGAVVFAKACELSLEGIASKPEGSFYRCARSRNWLKAKNPNFVRT